MKKLSRSKTTQKKDDFSQNSYVYADTSYATSDRDRDEVVEDKQDVSEDNAVVDDVFKLDAIEPGSVLKGGDDTNTGEARSADDIATGDTVDLSKLNEGVFLDLDINNQGALNPAPPSQEGVVRQGDNSIQLIDFENAIGTDFDDTLFGNQENNVILGKAGDDRIHPFGGVDFADGGEGVDTLLLNGTPVGLNIDLALGTAGPNTFKNFENANGSAVGDDVIFGDDNNNVLNGLGGNDILDGRGGIDTLIGGEGEDSFAFSGDPFKGLNLAADGRQIVNQPDELEDFSIAEDLFLLDAADLGIEGPISFINGTAEELAASDAGSANLVVIQGPFANAGAAASAIAQSGVGAGEGAFVYFNENLQINRLVYSTDLGSAEADISILANVRSLNGEAALNALPDFTADNFALQNEGQNADIMGDRDANILLGTAGEDAIDGGAGDDFIDGLEGVDTLTGGKGNDTFGFGDEPFKGVDVSAAGRQVVNEPDELTDFDIGSDQFALDRDVLGLGKKAVFINGTADELAAAKGQKSNIVVIQGPFANAGAAANAIAQSGAAKGTGAFIYFNENLQINRLVYSADLGSADADISILGNIRTLTGDDALDALPSFSADNFTLLDEQIISKGDESVVFGGKGNDLIGGSEGAEVLIGGRGEDLIFGNDGNDVIQGDRLDFDFGRNKGRGKGRAQQGGGDSLFGGDGNDVLLGGVGDDRLFGESGNDILVGGSGSDIFGLAAGQGTDVILDFEVGKDFIGLDEAISYGSLAFDGSKIQFGEETIADLIGVDTASLGEQSFVQV